MRAAWEHRSWTIRGEANCLVIFLIMTTDSLRFNANGALGTVSGSSAYGKLC